jgi:hypothetical protein
MKTILVQYTQQLPSLPLEHLLHMGSSPQLRVILTSLRPVWNLEAASDAAGPGQATTSSGKNALARFAAKSL